MLTRLPCFDLPPIVEIGCDCGWWGKEEDLDSRCRHGYDARSYYGPEPDEWTTHCPECGEHEPPFLRRYFRLTNRRTIQKVIP